MISSSRRIEAGLGLAAQRLAPLLLLLALILAAWPETATEMVSIWLRSGTFTHAFLVPPIAAWLAWRQRDELARVPVKPVPWLLLPIAMACFGWLLGDLAQVGVVTHFALVGVVILSVPAIFGLAVARVLAFPLAFLVFAVPFGDFAVPTLMDWTADFTVLAIRLSGIPIYREGLQFVIPSGTWSVVEACSGVRYLIASAMVGTLFAYLNYRTLRRRVAFVVVALLVPIVANWLRAYMIVMIGHLSDNRLAAGVDHLIYGWLFFGVVIGLMFVIGARWSEPASTPALPRTVEPAAAVAPAGVSGWVVTAAVVACVVGAALAADRLQSASTVPDSALKLPGTPAGWVESTTALPWAPAYRNPSATASTAAVRDQRMVWLWVAYYRGQRPDAKLITSANGIVSPDDDVWVRPVERLRPADRGLPAFRTGEIRRGHMLDGTATTRLRLWYLYWVDGRWVTGDAHTKALQAANQLLGRGDDGAVIALATPAGEDADSVLEEFARASLADIDRSLAAVRDTR